MKISLLVLPALSAFAFAAPAPNLLDKSCAYKKPWKHYPDNWYGCQDYNKDELAYKVQCIWYKPDFKDCKPYWKKYEEVGPNFTSAISRCSFLGEGMICTASISREPSLTSIQEEKKKKVFVIPMPPVEHFHSFKASFDRFKRLRDQTR